MHVTCGLKQLGKCQRGWIMSEFGGEPLFMAVSDPSIPSPLAPSCEFHSRHSSRTYVITIRILIIQRYESENLSHFDVEVCDVSSRTVSAPLLLSP